MRCIITSPVSTKAYDSLRSVVLPTVHGTEQIMSGHAEYITRIVASDVRLESPDGAIETVFIRNAVCWVSKDEVKIVL